MKIYKNLIFPTLITRPYFYANFVTTVDGKVQVLTNTKEYWPIGSELDYETLIDLRTYADALIHGKTTALGHPTIESINKPEFKRARKTHGKSEELPYVVISNHPGEEFLEKFRNVSQKPILVTNGKSLLPERSRRRSTSTHAVRSVNNYIEELRSISDIVTLGENQVELPLLSEWLFKQGYKHVLVEGGPQLFGSFLEASLIDELFLTISPKIFGNEKEQTLTLVEGVLFKPSNTKKLTLISNKTVEDEIYLRYKLIE